MSPNLTEVRNELPAVQASAYLNTGSYGPLSRAAATAVEEENRQQFEAGRLTSMGESGQSIPASLRAAFARVFGCEAAEVALTHHTTDGMNIATWGVQYRPGDEIVTNTWEHPGGILPVFAAARRFDLKVRMVPLEKDDDEETILAKFDRVIGPRTKLVSVAHVSWKTGTILPIDSLADLVHRHDGLLAVDGAQSGGAMRLDMASSGADFYAIPGQKWLCGPEGIGALYVDKERTGDLLQTYVGYPSLRDGGAYDETGIFLPPEGAKRYEVGTTYRPAMAGMWSGMQWLEELGLDWVYDRTQKMTQLTREALASIPTVRLVHTPTHAGLTSFTVDNISPSAAVERLAEDGVLIRSVPNPDLIRVSSHFFNNEDDIERLRAGIEGLNGSSA